MIGVLLEDSAIWKRGWKYYILWVYLFDIFARSISASLARQYAPLRTLLIGSMSLPLASIAMAEALSLLLSQALSSYCSNNLNYIKITYFSK